jgi:hypothetical protein
MTQDTQGGAAMNQDGGQESGVPYHCLGRPGCFLPGWSQPCPCRASGLDLENWGTPCSSPRTLYEHG